MFQPNFNIKCNQNFDNMQTTKKKIDLSPLSAKNLNKMKPFRRPQTYTKGEIKAHKRGSNRGIVISDSKILKNSRNNAMTDSGQNSVESVDQSPTHPTHDALPTVMNDYSRKNQQLYIRKKEIESKYNSLQTNMVSKKTNKPKAMKQEQPPQPPSPQPPDQRNSQNSEMLENAIQVLFTMKPRSKRLKRSKKFNDLSDECSEFNAEHIFEKNATRNKTPTISKVNTRWTFDEPISFSENSAECYKKLMEIKGIVQKQAMSAQSKVDTRWSFDVPSMTKSTTECYKQLLDIEDAAKRLERLQTEVTLHIASQPVQITTSTSVTNFPR